MATKQVYCAKHKNLIAFVDGERYEFFNGVCSLPEKAATKLVSMNAYVTYKPEGEALQSAAEKLATAYAERDKLRETVATSEKAIDDLKKEYNELVESYKEIEAELEEAKATIEELTKTKKTGSK